MSAADSLVAGVRGLLWADASSVDLLIRLLPVIEESPVLLVLTGRTERDVPGWRLVSQVRSRGEAVVELALGPLTHQASRELSDTLVRRHPLDQRLGDLVASKAEGNRLFVEELVRMLLDRTTQKASLGVDEPTFAAIRDTIHGLLLTRIDRVPPPSRRLLRVAAVMDREFPAALLDEIVEDDGEETGRQLAALEAAGLLRTISARPELVYAFRHALVYEAAYAMLLRQERRRLHRLVGETLERLFPQRRSELAAQLARHFERAGRLDRAGRYQLEAGEQALRRFANREALGFLEKASAYAVQAGADADTARFRLATLLPLGEASRASGDTPGAKATFEQAASRARDLEDVEAFARAALGYGKAADIWGVDTTLRELLEQALDRPGD